MTDNKTLHQRIVSDIQANIVSGEWPPGYKVPFEVGLAREYKCSRMTVNKALTQLASAGLVERRRKSGTFVSRPRVHAAILEIHDIAQEVEQTGLLYSYQLISRRVRQSREIDRSLLEMDDNGAVLAVTCLHHAGGAPFCLEERLISISAVPEAEAADFSHSAPGSWLMARVPWSAAEHRIQAISVGKPVAKRLQIAVNTACLVVERRTWDADSPITHVRFTYPGERHTLVASFAPASGGH